MEKKRMATATLPANETIGLDCPPKTQLPFTADNDPVVGIVLRWEAIQYSGQKSEMSGNLGDPNCPSSRCYKSLLWNVWRLMQLAWKFESERDGLLRERDAAIIAARTLEGDLKTANHRLTELQGRFDKLKKEGK